MMKVWRNILHPHKKKLLTCLTCLARLWVKFFDLRVWEKVTLWKASKNCFVEVIKWPKEERDSFLLSKTVITTFESPLIIIEGRLRSIAKEISWAVAIHSTSFKEEGSLTFSNRNAVTTRRWLQTTTPNPTSPESTNTTPLKFILRDKGSGGIQWT